MGKVDDFADQYRKRRRDMCMNLANSDMSDCNKFFARVAGFFIVEHAVMNRYQTLITQADLQSWWENVLLAIKA